jgi:hypothetical protein
MEVQLDRPDAQSQFASDFFIREATRDQERDVAFASGQTARPLVRNAGDVPESLKPPPRTRPMGRLVALGLFERAEDQTFVPSNELRQVEIERRQG